MVDSINKEPVIVLNVETWEAARALALRLPLWAFRGHANADWKLESGLFRRAISRGWLPKHLANRELQMLQQFQRRAHNYVTDPPDKDNHLEWLALIQHFGGPTRLLDFTYSFYVAAFFAVEDTSSDSAIWAINTQWADNGSGIELSDGPNLTETNRRKESVIQGVLKGGVQRPLAICVEPERLNERLVAQQGAFVVPCDLTSSFEENLCATYDLPSSAISSAPSYSLSLEAANNFSPFTYAVLKIVLPRRSHYVALDDLHNMNVSAATLFPGLGGFARSLMFMISLMNPQDDELFDRYGITERK